MEFTKIKSDYLKSKFIDFMDIVGHPCVMSQNVFSTDDVQIP
ncbi:hypothetical protein GILI108418_16400 [Gillisia limnaea]|uniref:Uncharacterized protein n=1 Tax=Gillisia limnaea (strain DSM 15749 / LMG 21470 / R-8282) TaxID=865937 RepID=H2BR20_GILLR|nr:hypothetical protein Gilli_0185 [Gillisia limnaea DSM 15749]